MRIFFATVTTGLFFMGSSLGTLQAQPAHRAKKDVGTLSRTGSLVAWASTLGAYVGGGLVLNKGVAMATSGTLGWLTNLSPETDVAVGSWVGMLTAVPLTIWAYASYREIVWYIAYITWTGQRYSPLMAQKALKHLAQYVNHLNMLKNIHKELSALIDSATEYADAIHHGELVVGGNVKPTNPLLQLGDHDILHDTLQDSTTPPCNADLISSLQSAIAESEKKVTMMHQTLAQCGFYKSWRDCCCTRFFGREPRAIEMALYRTCQLIETWISRDEKPTINHAEVAILDRLIRELLAYWHDYVTGLTLSLEKEIGLCQAIYKIEQMMVLGLDWKLSLPEIPL